MARRSRSTESRAVGGAASVPGGLRARLYARPAAAAIALSLALVALVALVGVATAEGRYLLRAGYEEARILAARRPLHKVLDDPALPAGRGGQLQQVLAAREFAIQRLGLDAGATYTSFADVGAGPLLWVVSASPRERLEEYRWWYPIVGSVPYKGFFDQELAEAAIGRLADEGYDTHLRTAAAFSTLGWLPDPLLSTALDPDPAGLAATVLHEIAHDALWVPGDVAFNESFATWVGLRGAEAFLAAEGDRRAAARAGARWRDEKRLEAFYGGLAAELESLYGSSVAGQTRDRSRAVILERARRTLAGPLAAQLEVYSGDKLAEAELNNASVLANRVYRTDLEAFDRVLMLTDDDLARAIARVVEAVEDRDDEVSAGEAVAAVG